MKGSSRKTQRVAIRGSNSITNLREITGEILEGIHWRGLRDLHLGGGILDKEDPLCRSLLFFSENTDVNF